MREERLVNKSHVIAIKVVGLVVEDGGQSRHEPRIVVFGVVGLVLNFVHQRVGIGQQIFDTDQILL
jgi:hypothetical protein